MELTSFEKKVNKLIEEKGLFIPSRIDVDNVSESLEVSKEEAYKICKEKQVKFTLKIVAGSELDDYTVPMYEFSFFIRGKKDISVNFECATKEAGYRSILRFLSSF